MAQIQNQKSNFYSQKQSFRDELLAPQHLESAGDVLIKNLARKQTNTCTSLQEQLEIVQHFEKGFQLNPDNRRGVTSLEEFKKHTHMQSDTPASPKRETTRSLNELMRDTGLTRHELELGLCEKPNSTISQLYMFALGNKRRSNESFVSGNKLLDHPINHLKEIEEKCFGQKKKKSESVPEDGRVGKGHKRKKRRNRKRKACGNAADYSGKHASKSEPPKSMTSHKEKKHPEAPLSRPSLWDVRDMKKWSESEKIGCRPPAFYTIKNGKIIKLEEK